MSWCIAVLVFIPNQLSWLQTIRSWFKICFSIIFPGGSALVAVGLVWSRGRKSCANGSLANGILSQAGRVMSDVP